jgi:hypothetical protein
VSLTYTIVFFIVFNIGLIIYLLKESKIKKKRITNLQGTVNELNDNGTYCILSYNLLLITQVMLCITVMQMLTRFVTLVVGPRY